MYNKQQLSFSGFHYAYFLSAENDRQLCPFMVLSNLFLLNSFLIGKFNIAFRIRLIVNVLNNTYCYYNNNTYSSTTTCNNRPFNCEYYCALKNKLKLNFHNCICNESNTEYKNNIKKCNLIRIQ